MTREEFKEKLKAIENKPNYCMNYLDLFAEALEQDNFSELWFGDDEEVEP